MIQNFVSDDLNHLEGLRRCYGINEHVAMNPDKMLRVEDTVLILKLGQFLASSSPGGKNAILPDQLCR